MGGQELADCMKAECECPSVWKKMAESCQLLLAEEDQLECREDVCATGDSIWVRAAHQANQATFQQQVALEKKEKADELLEKQEQEEKEEVDDDDTPQLVDGKKQMCKTKEP